MGWNTLRLLAIPATLIAIALGAPLVGHDRSDFDRRLPVGPGGRITADVVLKGGLAFEHGALHIRSHDAEDVRVLADTTGWGKYAVDLDLSHEGSEVQLVGRVDGPLAWLFGGPTVNLSVWVPRDFSVKARVEGGPLVLEDLAGPITADVDETDVTLRRAEGRVQITSKRGSVDAEDVDGDLTVRSEEGEIDIRSVRGSLLVDSEHGEVEIESVTGALIVKSGTGSVEIDRVLGDVTVTTERAGIVAEEIEGRVVARTQRGRIQLEDVDGEVLARSERGSIEVEFEGDPHGDLETGRGSISVKTPDGAGFDLDARTGRGRVRIGEAAEEFGDGDHDDDDLGIDAPDDDPGRRFRRRAGNDVREGERERGFRRFRGDELVREVNGGGESLRVRTGRGSIRIRD